MASIRYLRPFAELATRQSQVSLSHRPSALAVASRNYYNCSCRNNKPLNTTVSRMISSTQRATYTSTSSALASSPFRLNSSPKQQSQPQTPEDEDARRYEHEEEGEGEYYSPYKPKRQWPPDMSKLSPKHQLRLERKYRRRAALKYARPRWVKFTKLAQWGIIIFVVIYSLLFMEWGKEGEEHPFEDFRKDLFASINSLFSAPERPIRKKE
ncbi:hypothetical protein TMatcc_000240 [Talaromyces marneffei ATCC 18224]|uniref:Uncharacterized protein n=2 Tax=Talaromyces marneffei TaxID=37727 RepID=B6QQF2_TALMQ|nr:uncharacterized protein EYB26_005336 [Talaromyces marneffei]EEA20256.1 conserved hypothetical protein [Talaromyces marneffei ATCC 18224]KAE8549264.1 hypothetical protein EYB25_007784 [Talaromyces marneffei]QGA17661.1 hypothetical protein EYB26_005336 [Talaromyces marneffei]